MSFLRITCNGCGSSFKVHARFAGQQGTCPNEFCGQTLRVPAIDHPPRHRQHGTPADSQTPLPDNRRPALPSRPVARRKWLLGGGVMAAALAALILMTSGFPGQKGATVSVAHAAPPAAADSTPPQKAPPDDSFERIVQPFLTKYCIDCHGKDYAEAEFNLEKFSGIASAIADRKTWDKVESMLDIGAMPPEGTDPSPTMDEVEQILDWIDQKVYFVDCNLPPDPGRVTIRRLNRNEYDNTIRDLIGLDLQLADDFPSDDVGYGFDNIGDVLSLSPLLAEKYLDAAEKIAEKALVPDDPTQGRTVRLDGEKLEGHNARLDGGDFWSMASTAHVTGEFEFPVSGDYILRVEAKASQAGKDKAKIEFRIDGKPVHVAEIHEHQTPELLEFKLRVEKGKRPFAAAFINDYYNPKAEDPKDRDRNAYVRWLEVQGPLGVTLNDLPEAHRRIVFTRPNKGEPPQRAAREVLRAFAKRAWRRPVADEEIEPLVELVAMVVEQEESFERGIQVAMQAVLVSPHFLFRIEKHPAPNDPQKTHAIGQYELASRLSYFLWSSMPDEQLFTLAERHQLHKPDVLEEQVRRMLKDPKAEAFVRNFGGQWLNLRLLDESFPHRRTFPEFNQRLRVDMRRETELVFAEIVRQDGSILDFLDADFTFVNERLAKHYGIEGVKGDKFQKVSLKGTHRAGVLTHASILTLTSDPTRTSPVKRGKWILENILGTPPPPPPPSIPPLEETVKNNPKLSLREQMALHRADPVCASCHKLMDPLGLGFENFDGIGRWREKDGRLTIDPSGALPGGETFEGAKELIEILKGRKDQFARHFARQMLTYALGRGLEHYDRCTIDKLTEALARNDYRFSTLVVEITKSAPFLQRRGEGENR